MRKTLSHLGRAAVCALGLASATPALAHPHIFIDAELDIVFNGNGAVSELRHRWTFDSLFSTWAVQGLDSDGDGTVSPAEMQELAEENVSGLSEYHFYTFAGDGQRDLDFRGVGTPSMSFANDRTTLSFAVAPETPYFVRPDFEIAVNDPEYYVAISFRAPQDVKLIDAPAGCSAVLHPPQELSPELEDQLYALGPDVTQLPEGLANAMRGVQGAIALDCPPNPLAEQTPLDAIAEVAPARPTPFGGPPPEVGMPMARDGLLGWIGERQRSFYAAINDALTALKSDGNGFWVLGGLSFLYGVFHAAGPGHGKVVISSYVMANERQFRRGVALSFASALLQGLVAVAFVLVAAGLMRMTSLAMSSAARWIEIGSFVLVMLLGVWLVVRHLLGLGHGRHEHHHRDHDHDHHHHEHEHAHHVVTPQQTGGSWREQLAVVLAVGLRPCSGALVVLVFALSQGLLAAGVVAVLLMSLGTAITVAVLASIAVGAKGLALRLGGGGAVSAGLVWWLELAGGLAVAGFGLLLLLASL